MGARVGQERELRVELQASAGGHGQRLGRVAARLAQRLQRGVADDRAVALVADRRGPGHDGVALRPQAVKQLAVTGAPQPPRAPVERAPAVERRDHVERQMWPAGREAQLAAQPVEELAGVGRGAGREQPPESHHRPHGKGPPGYSPGAGSSLSAAELMQ